MPSDRSPQNDASKRRRHRLGLVLIAAALALLATAWMLWWVHVNVGPDVRTINVRWKIEVSAGQRAEAERALGLERGVNAGGRTWEYFLSDRSRTAVSAILTSPLIEDTHHLNREQYRIDLEPPNPNDIHHPAERILLRFPSLLAPLQAEYLPRAAAALMITAFILLVIARRALMWLLRLGFRLARRVADILGSAGDALLRFGNDGAARPALSSAEIFMALAMSLLFLAPLLWYGPYEEEVIQHSIFPNQMFYRALFRGEWLYWLHDLGFGTPLPGDMLMFHPIAGPLLAFASLRVALSALWLAHTALMAIYFLRLLGLSKVRSPVLRLCLLACYLWSAVGMVYFYDTDWITNAIAWSVYPVLVFHLAAAVREEVPRLKTIVGLAVLFAFWILNAHPGYVAPAVSVLVVYAFAAATVRVRVYAGLGIAAALCVVATSAHLYALAHEASLFDAATRFDRDGATLKLYTDAALTFGTNNRRAPLIGLALLVSAVAGVLARATRHDPHLRGCAAAFVASVGFSLLPREAVQWLAPSGASLFRDPYIFFGLLLGGTMLQRWIDSGHTRLVALLLVAQGVQQDATVVRPALYDLLGHTHVLLFYRYQDRAVDLARDIVDASHRFGRRFYLSPDVDVAMRGGFSPAGVHFSSDLALIGLNPVNGWFKNVAMGAIAPPTSMMESFISGKHDVIANDALLDVLGINFVLTSEPEGPVPHLKVIMNRRVRQSRAPIDGDLMIAANVDAWPEAVLLDAAAAALTLPTQPGCGHTAALCRDYRALVPLRRPETVSLRAGHGVFSASFAPAQVERLLFISGLYRPEWEATLADGTRLSVRPVAGAFLGVTVPPGAGQVTVVYQPRTLRALTWLSGLTFGGLCVAWAVLRRRDARTDGMMSS